MNLNIDKSNWKKVKLNDVCEWYQKNIPNEIQFELGIKYYVTATHIDSDSIKFNRYNLLSDGQKGPTITKHFQKGDLLLSTRSVELRKAALAPIDGVTGEKLLVIRLKADSELTKDLMPFVFQSIDFWEFAQNSASGSVNKFTSWTKIREYEFLLPPKEEQSKLAELLWAMDEVIEKEKEVLDKEENLFLSYSNSIFSKDNGTLTSLKDIGVLIMGQSPDGSTYNESGDGMPFLQGNAEFGEIHPKYIKYTTAPNKIVQEKTILISVRAPVGDLNIADREYCIGRGLAGLYIEDESLRNFIFNFLKYSKSEMEKNSTGSTFKAINKDTLSALKCNIPESKELQSYSSKFNTIASTLNFQRVKISSSQGLQKSLINQLF